MSEKLIHWWEQIATTALFAFVGISIGIGQLLASGEAMTPRIIIGRSLCTGGIAMAAGAVLVWVPDLPIIGQVGVAAALASLGTSGLERMFQRIIQGRSA
ncbi:MAG: putative Holin [Proteobacteria bacterium]|nr:putative Holin [Pseudomonadota bacterium]